MDVQFLDLGIFDNSLRNYAAKIRCDILALQIHPLTCGLEVIIVNSGNNKLPQILTDNVQHSWEHNKMCTILGCSNATVFYSFGTKRTEQVVRKYVESQFVASLLYNCKILKDNGLLTEYKIEIVSGRLINI